MGCSASIDMGNNQNLRSRTSTEDISYITETEKRIVRKTWNHNLSRDIKGTGVKIFLHIFLINPELKQIFPFRNYDENALLKDSCFKGHASRFMQAMGAAIDNMDDLHESMGPMLVDLGEQHFCYEGFKPEYWDIFSEAVHGIWKQVLRRKYVPKVVDAWEKVFVFMVSKLNEGYTKATHLEICKMEHSSEGM